MVSLGGVDATGETLPGPDDLAAIDENPVRAFGDVDLAARSAAMAISVLVALLLLPLVFVYARATRRGA